MFLHNVSFVTNCRFVSATVSSHFSAVLGMDYAYVLSGPEHYARLWNVLLSLTRLGLIFIIFVLSAFTYQSYV